MACYFKVMPQCIAQLADGYDKYMMGKSTCSNNVIGFCDASQQLSRPRDKPAPTHGDVTCVGVMIRRGLLKCCNASEEKTALFLDWGLCMVYYNVPTI